MAKSKSELTNEALRVLTSGGKLTAEQRKLLGYSSPSSRNNAFSNLKTAENIFAKTNNTIPGGVFDTSNTAFSNLKEAEGKLALVQAKIAAKVPLTDEDIKILGESNATTSSTTSSTTTTAVPSMTAWIVNLLKNVPELSDIYNSVKNEDGSFNRTVDVIIDMITASKWYLDNGPTVAANVASRYKFGEKFYQEKVNQYKITISGLATAIGLDVKDPMVAEYLESLAETSFLSGWDEDYIENKIISDDKVIGKINGGAYATAVDDLAEYGQLMGFTLSDTTRKDYQRRLIGEVTEGGLRSRSTPDQIKKEIRDKQALLYPMFSDDFAVGRTLWDVTASQRKMWASLLEQNEDDLDWSDPLWKDGKIFTMTDEKTGKIVARPAWDAEKLIKQDERWQYTENANRMYESYGIGILNKFGLAAI